jgi:PDZ domain-containing protein
VLEAGDVIVAIEGRRVATASDVDDLVGSRPPGSTFRLRVERDVRILDVQPASWARRNTPGEPRTLGAVLQTRTPRVSLPFDVRFRPRALGGPSAGLVYGLVVADMLGPGDLGMGRAIAATGTIDPTGEVGPIGFVDEKAHAADRAHAESFLVPAVQLGDATRHHRRARGVGSLQDAIALLRST